MTTKEHENRNVVPIGWLVGIFVTALFVAPFLIKWLHLFPEPTQGDWEARKAERYRSKAEGLRKKAEFYRRKATKYEKPSR